LLFLFFAAFDYLVKECTRMLFTLLLPGLDFFAVGFQLVLYGQGAAEGHTKKLFKFPLHQVSPFTVLYTNISRLHRKDNRLKGTRSW
jgi:hypothetical protein